MAESFVYGKAAPEANFIGREKESLMLEQDFLGGINTILISPRRWGKTSLVNHVCRHINDKDLMIIKLDIFGCKSEYEFYNLLASAVLQQTANKREHWLEEAKDFIFRLTPKFSVSPEPTSEYSVSLGITPKTHSYQEVLSLPENIARKKGKRIVICIDEFQQVGEWQDSKSIQGRLRSIWQLQEHVSYCLYGSKRHLMASIFANKSMPFYQFGDVFWLKRIPTETWVPYIKRQFKESGAYITDEMAEKVCDTVDNFSSYVQQLARYLQLATPKGHMADDDGLKNAIQRLLDINEMLFMQQVEPLSAYQMNFLRAIASGNHDGFSESSLRGEFDLGSPSNIVRLKKALIEKDLIYTEMKKVYFADPVFELWFSRKYL